ncbi:MAG: hypothetical protein ACOVRB_01790 [Akkermansiaceae bacterium]
MKTSLYYLCVSFAITSCTPPTPSEPSHMISEQEFAYGTAQQYGGNVGTRFAMFQLIWQSNGNVVGGYYHPDDQGRISYELKGKNTAEGQMVLTEFTRGKPTAILTLHKTRTSSDPLITWSGEMHNMDGRVFPVSITRSK